MLRISVRNLLLPLVAVLSVLALACTSEPEPVPPTVPAPNGAASAPAPAPAATSLSKSGAFDTAGPPWSDPPKMIIDPNKKYTAIMELEKGGEIKFELFAKQAPVTVNSFVALSREGFYDGVTFHRVLQDFMAQGGDPTGTGTGSAGYRFDNEIHPDLHHDSPGILSMANAGVRDGQGTNGSQFFITFVPTPPLDGHGKDCTAPRVSCHTVFGKVVEGMDVVNNISLRDPQTATTPGDAIKTIRIVEE